jgi:hypothetical protein
MKSKVYQTGFESNIIEIDTEDVKYFTDVLHYVLKTE